MDPETTAASVAVAVVVATLLLSGPAMSAVSLGQSGTTGLDDGTATVADVAFADPVRITPGRFGTGVAYLRVPAVTVRLSSVSGHPRVVYRVSVPTLGVRAVETELLGPGSRRVRVDPADRALAEDVRRGDGYTATVSVHVQSFETYRTVAQRNVTVGASGTGGPASVGVTSDG